jgi:hypothetical protein
MVDDLHEELVRAALRESLDAITPRPHAFERLMAAVRAEAGRPRTRPLGLRGVRTRALRPLAVATLLSFAVGGAGAAAVHGRLGAHGGGGPGSARWSTDAPPPRAGSMMAYDPVTRTVVLFGGRTATAPDAALADTWTWDGSRWRRHRPSTSPPPSGDGLMAFDPNSATVILYIDRAHAASGTWSWDGNVWHRVQAGGPAANGLELALDRTARSPMLLTGSGPCTTMAWYWTGATWVRATGPGPRRGTSEDMITDPASGHVALITTSYSGSGPIIPGPPTALCGAEGSTWQWDGSSWHERRFRSAGPAGPFDGATDDASGQVVVFTDSGETWTSDSGTWSRQHPRHSPSPRTGASMVFDAATRTVMLFGGWSGGRPLGDTWTWDGADWTAQPCCS